MSETNDPDQGVAALSQRFGPPAAQNDLDARHWRASVANTLFGKPPEPVRVGRFTVLTRMGSGGSGSVFSAWDPKLERRVALKLLHAGHDAAAVEREAKLLARLNHPHVVAVYDVGDHDGAAFLAMEFVEGATLDTWLQKTGPTHTKLLALFDQIASGLEAAHAVGVVHGDIKPANILVGSDDRARLGDFGIGRLADEAGLRGGTPAYMAPEQIAGAPAGFASDQFSLCLTLFECLSGQRPFSETTAEARRAAIKRGPPSLPSGVPGWLEASLRQGLALDPKARHHELTTLRASWKHGQRRAQRRVVGGSLAAAVLVGAGLAAVGLDSDAQPNACEAMATRVRSAWSPKTRAALEATFESQPTAYAPVAWARVSDALDRHINALDTFVGHACESADTERRLRQQLCAERRLTEFEALLDVLSTGDAEVVERSVAALSTLTPPSACSGAAPLPSSAQDDLVEREALHRTIARARALRGVGKTDAAVDLLHASLEGARDLADPRLTALAQLELGEHIAETEGVVDGGAALPTLESAYNAALAAEDRHLAATVLLALASANFRSARFPAAVRWLKRLEQANRSLDDARLSGRAAVLVAMLSSVRDGDEDPVPTTEALAQLQRTGARDTWLAAGLNNLGEIEFNVGNYAAARRHYEHALQIWIEVLGPAHPNVAGGRGNLGEVEMFAGDLDAARAQFEQAEKVAAAWGEQSRWTVHTRAHLGDIERVAGNLDAAHAYYQGVLDFTSKGRPLKGRENFFEVDSGARQLEPWARNGLALLALGRGDGRRALELTEPLPPGVEIRVGRHPDLAARVDVHAQALLAVGRPADALAWLEQEGPAAQAAYPGHFKAAYVPLTRARVLLALGRTTEACGHVAQAQAILRGDSASPAEALASAKALAATCARTP